MREKTIEKKLVQAVKNEGGMCPKLVSPGTDGMPDRMVLLPEARIGFVEVKAMSNCGSSAFRSPFWTTQSRSPASLRRY